MDVWPLLVTQSAPTKENKDAECTRPYILSQETVEMSFPTLKQGIDGSARKPALRKDTGYMVEKTYTDIPPYLGAFGA